MADNLLDKASILLTPTAYDNGRMLSVKPNENLYGTEEVTNGDFATDSDWTKGVGITISGGSANFTGNSNAFLTQSSVVSSGKKYKATFTITNYVSGAIDINLGGSTRQGNVSANGTYSFYITVSAGNILYFQEDFSNGFVGSIDNISVVEDLSGDFDFTRGSAATRVNAQGLVENVQIISSELVSNGDFSQEGSELVTNGDFATDSDWTAVNSGGWTISGGSANSDGTSSASAIYQQNILVVGKTYKITFTTIITSGTVAVSAGFSGTGTSRTVSGTYTEILTAATNDELYIKGTSNFIGSIDNVSVKEVGQDWSLNNGAAIAEDKATIIGDGSVFGYVEQLSTFVSGKKYKVTLDAIINSGGGLVVKYALGFSANIGSITTSGSYTFYYTAGVSGSIIIGRSTGGVAYNSSVTNISIKEITDDTNIPRINYEGFSYQDALGNELVTNGDFATDSNWSKGGGWSISGGKAEALNVNGSYLVQNISFTNAKTYKIQFSVSDYLSGEVRIRFSGGGGFISTDYVSGNNTHTLYLQSIGNTVFRLQGQNNFTGSIDNVSVKEVTGQEVVPDSGCGSWLLEPQTTNLYNYSEPTANEGTSGGVTYESFNWAIGFTNCVKYGDNSVTRYRYGGTVSASTEYTLSAFVIMDDLSEPMIGGQTSDKDFSFVLGGAVGVGVNSSVNMGNNIWRVSGTATTSASPNASNNGIIKYTAQSNKGFRVVGFQVEQQSYATSYIPTNGAIATRLADAATNSGNSTLINSTEGVLYAEISALDSSNIFDFGIYGNTTTNQCRIGFFNNDVYASLFNGSFQTQMSAASDLLNFTKIAFKFKQNDFSLWINGNEVATDTSGTTFNTGDLVKLNLSAQNGTSSLVTGKVKSTSSLQRSINRCTITIFNNNIIMIHKRYTFTDKAQADSKIEKFFDIDEEGNKIPNERAAFIYLDKFVLTQGEYDEEGVEIVAPIYSEGYALDAVWHDLEESPYGWKSYEVEPDNPLHKLF